MLPIGVTTFELTFGQTFDYEGVSLQTDLTIVPSHEVRTAAGERIVPALIETSSPVGEYGSIDLPQPGQGNLYDLKGNLITNWWYTVTAVDSKAGRTVGDMKVWKLQPTIDQMVVDLDTQPTDQVVGPVGSVAPPAVTSVNGRTGAVVTAEVDGDGKLLESQVPERLSDANLSLTFATVVSLAQFVQSGEALNADNTGNGNNSAVLQRAVDALNTAYLADGRPRQIYVPEGVFRLAAQIEWKSGVGVRGAGRGKTAFRPQANQAAFNHEPSGLAWLDDCQFEDFTINGADQTSTATDSFPKGFRFLFARRLYVARVNVVNTWATGFGFDGCDGLVTDCYADNCGRCHPRDADGMAAGNGFGSGFGIGVGAREYEPFVMDNCVSNNCGTNGFFREHLINRSEFIYHAQGFRLLNSSATGNKHGFLDAGGTGGAIVNNCVFYANLYAGINLRPSFTGTTGGSEGTISNCTISKNGLPTVTSGSNVNSGGGIVLVDTAGDVTIENNRIRDNNGPGIWFTSLSTVGPGIRIRRNVVRGNAKSGILCENTSATLDKLLINGNELSNNGVSGVTYRDGITIRSNTTRASIKDNTAFDDRSDKQQQRGLDIQLTTRSAIQLQFDQNNFYGNRVEGYRIQQVQVDTTFIGTRNVTTGAGGYWSDTFTRANGALGQASPGLDWETSGTSNAAIVSNQLGTTGAIAGGARGTSMIDSGLAVGVLRATCAIVGTNSTAELVIAGTDYNNYLGVTARVDSSNRRWRLVNRTSGTSTTILDLGVASANGDVFVITRASDGTVTIVLNGSTVYNAIPGVYASATKAGVHWTGTNSNDDARWDDMSFQAS